MTKIEYALLAALMLVTLIGAAGPLRHEMAGTFDRIAAALAPGPNPPCIGLGCVEPAAGPPDGAR